MIHEAWKELEEIFSTPSQTTIVDPINNDNLEVLGRMIHKNLNEYETLFVFYLPSVGGSCCEWVVWLDEDTLEHSERIVKYFGPNARGVFCSTNAKSKCYGTPWPAIAEVKRILKTRDERSYQMDLMRKVIDKTLRSYFDQNLTWWTIGAVVVQDKPGGDTKLIVEPQEKEIRWKIRDQDPITITGTTTETMDKLMEMIQSLGVQK